MADCSAGDAALHTAIWALLASFSNGCHACQCDTMRALRALDRVRLFPQAHPGAASGAAAPGGPPATASRPPAPSPPARMDHRTDANSMSSENPNLSSCAQVSGFEEEGKGYKLKTSPHFKARIPIPTCSSASFFRLRCTRFVASRVHQSPRRDRQQAPPAARQKAAAWRVDNILACVILQAATTKQAAASTHPHLKA